MAGHPDNLYTASARQPVGLSAVHAVAAAEVGVEVRDDIGQRDLGGVCVCAFLRRPLPPYPSSS